MPGNVVVKRGPDSLMSPPFPGEVVNEDERKLRQALVLVGTHGRIVAQNAPGKSWRGLLPLPEWSDEVSSVSSGLVLVGPPVGSVLWPRAERPA